jgi:hypothetical protein
MYACVLGTSGGFFEGVCRLEDRPLIFRDPPPTTSQFAN